MLTSSFYHLPFVLSFYDLHTTFSNVVLMFLLLSLCSPTIIYPPMPLQSQEDSKTPYVCLSLPFLHFSFFYSWLLFSLQQPRCSGTCHYTYTPLVPISQSVRVGTWQSSSVTTFNFILHMNVQYT